MNISGLKQENAKAIGTILIVLAVIVAGFLIINKVFGGINGLLEALGLKSDPTETEAKKTVEDERENPNEAWSPTYWQNYNGNQLLTTEQYAKDAAVLLFNSVGFFYDVPAKAVGVIKGLKTKSQVSFIAYWFQKTYKRDLFNYLYEHFDTGDQLKAMEDMISWVKKLPARTV